MENIPANGTTIRKLLVLLVNIFELSENAYEIDLLIDGFRVLRSDDVSIIGEGENVTFSANELYGSD